MSVVVKTGKAQCEHMLSAVHPTTDIDPRGAEIKNSAPHLEPNFAVLFWCECQLQKSPRDASAGFAAAP
jgi:hypothetical protein